MAPATPPPTTDSMVHDRAVGMAENMFATGFDLFQGSVWATNNGCSEAEGAQMAVDYYTKFLRCLKNGDRYEWHQVEKFHVDKVHDIYEEFWAAKPKAKLPPEEFRLKNDAMEQRMREHFKQASYALVQQLDPPPPSYMTAPHNELEMDIGGQYYVLKREKQRQQRQAGIITGFDLGYDTLRKLCVIQLFNSLKASVNTTASTAPKVSGESESELSAPSSDSEGEKEPQCRLEDDIKLLEPTTS